MSHISMLIWFHDCNKYVGQSLRYTCNMQIQLSKFLDKPATLSCVRDDGSVMWQNYGKQGDFFPIHDLSHFVVETELCY